MPSHPAVTTIARPYQKWWKVYSSTYDYDVGIYRREDSGREGDREGQKRKEREPEVDLALRRSQLMLEP
jgi:hypothetical protein